MKTICGVLTAALVVLMSSMAAGAAEYQHFSGEAKTWRTGIVEWLHKFKPTPDNVSVGISGEDVHAYLVPGQFPGTYSVLRMKHSADKPSGSIRAFMDGATGKILGFHGESVYVLTWTKQ